MAQTQKYEKVLVTSDKLDKNYFPENDSTQYSNQIYPITIADSEYDAVLPQMISIPLKGGQKTSWVKNPKFPSLDNNKLIAIPVNIAIKGTIGIRSGGYGTLSKTGVIPIENKLINNDFDDLLKFFYRYPERNFTIQHSGAEPPRFWNFLYTGDWPKDPYQWKPTESDPLNNTFQKSLGKDLYNLGKVIQRDPKYYYWFLIDTASVGPDNIFLYTSPDKKTHYALTNYDPKVPHWVRFNWELIDEIVKQSEYVEVFRPISNQQVKTEYTIEFKHVVDYLRKAPNQKYYADPNPTGEDYVVSATSYHTNRFEVTFPVGQTYIQSQSNDMAFVKTLEYGKPYYDITVNFDTGLNIYEQIISFQALGINYFTTLILQLRTEFIMSKPREDRIWIGNWYTNEQKKWIKSQPYEVLAAQSMVFRFDFESTAINYDKVFFFNKIEHPALSNENELLFIHSDQIENSRIANQYEPIFDDIQITETDLEWGRVNYYLTIPNYIPINLSQSMINYITFEILNAFGEPNPNVDKTQPTIIICKLIKKYYDILDAKKKTFLTDGVI